LETKDGMAYLTSDEMREADEEAISQYGIDVLSLMENAGSSVASLARTLLGGRVEGRRIAVLVGKGNNGGDGLVAARHLHNWGSDVEVILGDRGALGPVPQSQFLSVERAGVRVCGPKGRLDGFDLVVDALLGYNVRGNPREPLRAMILSANSSETPALAVDVPSGLDATTGEPGDPCIEAAATLTLGFPKTGFLNPKSRPYVGSLYLGDVSIPIEVYRERSQRTSPFGAGPVARIW
jgi:NAD(P)H-hydrate epimerase